MALDKPVWDCPGIGKRGFELARRVLGSKVEDIESEVTDISPERVGVFDLVLFLGVLYHMRHPLLALERVASVTGKQLILETHVDMVEHDRPALAFYPEDECSHDDSELVRPEPGRGRGHAPGGRVPEDRDECPRSPYPKDFVRGAGESQFGRMVFHAWK